MRPEIARFARFGVVGAANTLLTLVAFALLTRVGVAAGAASAIGFAAGAANGYVFNSAWTFRARGALARYVPVQAVGALASATGVTLASTDARLHRLAAECLVVPAVTVLTYALSRRFVFRPSKGSPWGNFGRKSRSVPPGRRVGMR